MHPVRRLTCLLAAFTAFTTFAAAGRLTVSLEGEWARVDSAANALPPAFFPARPKRELAPGSTVAAPERPARWYARTFRAPVRKEVARLRINDAPRGTAVWLNGESIGEHAAALGAPEFDLTPQLDWHGENRLVVRVGPAVVVRPTGFPTGQAFPSEGERPDLPASIVLLLMDNPVIESVQVAPRSAPAAIVVETRVRNHSADPLAVPLIHRVNLWQEHRRVASGRRPVVHLAPGETKVVREEIPLPHARLATAEHAQLFVLHSTTGGDTTALPFELEQFRAEAVAPHPSLHGSPSRRNGVADER